MLIFIFFGLSFLSDPTSHLPWNDEIYCKEHLQPGNFFICSSRNKQDTLSVYHQLDWMLHPNCSHFFLTCISFGHVIKVPAFIDCIFSNRTAIHLSVTNERKKNKQHRRAVQHNRELKQPLRRPQQERYKFAYLTMRNNSFGRFARAFFIFGHLADVLVLSTTWNELFYSCVDDVSIWWQMFNFVFLPPKRWFQFHSRTIRTHFAWVMTLNNWAAIAETRSYILRCRSRCRRRRVCLNSQLEYIYIYMHCGLTIDRTVILKIQYSRS